MCTGKVNNCPYYETAVVDGVRYISFTSTANRFYSRQITKEIEQELRKPHLTDSSVVAINRYIMGKCNTLDFDYCPSTIKRTFKVSSELREYLLTNKTQL